MTLIRGTNPQTWVLAAVMALALSGCGGARARYTSHLERGQEFLAAGNLDKASVEFRNAAQILPKEADPFYFNGRVAEARSNIREAMGFYSAALEGNPGHTAARAHLGKLLVFAGAAQRALDTVAPGLAAHPDDPDLLAVRAAARHQLKQDDSARADAERAVQLAPTNENAVAVLAALYADAKESEKAISLVSDAVAKAPASVDLHDVLANLYLSIVQPQKAEAQMRKIIDLRPMELSPRSQLALHLMRVHDLDGAQRVLEDAVQWFSKSKDQASADAAKLLLVDFIASQRSRQQGERTLRGYIAQDPDNMDLRLGLGSLLQRAGASSEAMTAYREIIQHDGTAAKALVARDRIAGIEVAQGHDEAARRFLNEVLQTNPRDDDALTMRATLELRSNDAASAVADLRAVLRDHPNSVALQRMLASAFVVKGEPTLAEETLRAAMQAAPDEVSIRIDLAQFLARTDRIAQAVSLLEETVTLLPDSVPAREALVRTYVAQRNLSAARAASEDLKARQPKWPTGYYLAGLIAAQEKHLDESEKNFEQGLQLQPRDLNLLAALAHSEMSRGAYDKAIGRVQSAVNADPNNAQLLNFLGGLFLERKDFAHAAQAFSAAITKDPYQWQAHRNLALVKVALDDTNGAVTEYGAALKLAPAEPQLVADAASFYEKQRRIDQAIQIYETLYKSAPRMQQFAANNLAMLLVTYKTDRGSLDRARDLTSSFDTSKSSTLLDTLGWVRFKRGEYKEALPALERAVAGAPDSKVMRYHLAMDELQLGLRDRARGDLEAVLSGSGTFSGADDARLALASLKSSAG